MEDEKNSAADDFAPKKTEGPIAIARKEWVEANAHVHECEKTLAKAKERMTVAGKNLHESRPQQSLADLNKQQRRITRTETRRRVKFQANLDKLAESGFNATRKVHPPLYTTKD